MKCFEVGKTYAAADCSFDPITVIRRTPKCIVVRGGKWGNEWRMKVRMDDKSEWVQDSCVTPKWRGAFTYRADDELT